MIFIWFLLLEIFHLPGFASQAPHSIEISVENEASPWSNPDGSGFANDIVIEAYKAVGIKARLTILPYARCKLSVVQGKSAACFSMSWTPEFQGKVVFSKKPLFTCNADFYTNANNPTPAKKESEIKKGQSIGIVIGYEYPHQILALKENGILFDEGSSEEMNLRKLALNRLDYAIINSNQIKPTNLLLEKNKIKDKIQYAFTGGTLESYIGFSVQHPRGSWAKETFDRGYNLIIQNGTLRKLERQWVQRANSTPPQK